MYSYLLESSRGGLHKSPFTISSFGFSTGPLRYFASMICLSAALDSASMNCDNDTVGLCNEVEECYHRATLKVLSGTGSLSSSKSYKKHYIQ